MRVGKINGQGDLETLGTSSWARELVGELSRVSSQDSSSKFFEFFEFSKIEVDMGVEKDYVGVNEVYYSGGSVLMFLHPPLPHVKSFLI